MLSCSILSAAHTGGVGDGRIGKEMKPWAARANVRGPAEELQPESMKLARGLTHNHGFTQGAAGVVPDRSSEIKSRGAGHACRMILQAAR
jgi:hypothetical protein